MLLLVCSARARFASTAPVGMLVTAPSEPAALGDFGTDPHRKVHTRAALLMLGAISCRSGLVAWLSQPLHHPPFLSARRMLLLRST